MDGRSVPVERPSYRGAGTVRPTRERHRPNGIALRTVRSDRGTGTRQPPTGLLPYRVDSLRQTTVAVMQPVAPRAQCATVTARNAWRAVPPRDWQPPGS